MEVDSLSLLHLKSGTRTHELTTHPYNRLSTQPLELDDAPLLAVLSSTFWRCLSSGAGTRSQGDRIVLKCL